MKKVCKFLTVLLLVGGILTQKTYAQYAPGYDDRAPIVGTEVGSNFLTVGLGLLIVGAVVGVVAATSGDDNHSSHNHTH